MRIVRAKLVETAQPANLKAIITGGPIPVGDLLASRFQAERRIPFYTDRDNSPRINVVTDSIGRSSMYGGVATAVILGALLSRHLNWPLRIITRTEPPEPDRLREVLKSNFVDLPKQVSFVTAFPSDTGKPIHLSENDKFLSTSWWTTSCLINSCLADRIVYLLQEDERMFYPVGDDYLQAETVFKDDRLKFLVNTNLLLSHFQSEGLLKGRNAALAFEPAFSEKVFFVERRKKPKFRFGFYARQHNPRNLYWFGLEVLNEAVQRNIFDPAKWEFVFFGKDIPRIEFPNGINVVYKEALPWSEYAEMARSLDSALALMSTPHPSYPPLDLAASGCRVITNTYKGKEDLSLYSSRIHMAALDVESMIAVVGDQVRRIESGIDCHQDDQGPNLNRDWREALAPAVEFCKGAWLNVRG